MEDKKELTPNQEIQKALEFWASDKKSELSTEGISPTANSVAALAHSAYLICRKASDRATEFGKKEDDALLMLALLGINQISHLLRAYVEKTGEERARAIDARAAALCATIDTLGPKKPDEPSK